MPLELTRWLEQLHDVCGLSNRLPVEEAVHAA
jgi:hypothetical protein